MASFSSMVTNDQNPTPYGFFDEDSDFQGEADNFVTFAKRKLGDDVLSVELTRKMFFGNLEEATLEYSSIINQYQAKSQLLQFMGMPTGSYDAEQKYPRENLQYLARFAEPYAMEAGVGGSYDMLSGSIDLVTGQQDYDINTDLKNSDGNVMFDVGQNAEENFKTKLKISEVFHFSPQAAYRFFDTTSAINYLNNEFSFESFTPETIFYVLPVFEDILRAGQLDLSNRVRRSNYSYKIIGTKIRIFPTPTQENPRKLFLRVMYNPDPLNPSYQDDTIHGVSNLSNVPFGNLIYNRVNSIGRQWIRQFALALCKEQLGEIRSKFSSVPIPGSDVSLNGSDLLSRGREDKKELVTQLKEMLETMTYDKLLEVSSTRAELIQKQLKFIPIPNGNSITIG
jgi:hypothetical protein